MDLEELIITRPTPGVTCLSLNRPQELNAWTYDLEERFFAALNNLRHDPETRVVLITGRGRAFCAGMSMTALSAAGRARQVAPPAENRPRMTEISAFPKPTIAVVNGPAAGIGLALALHCDLRFVATTAKLTTSFARRGLIAEHGTAWLLPRLVGIATATDLLLTGRVVLGEEARSLGLANYCAPPDELLAAATAYADEMARHCSPRSWDIIKGQLAHGFAVGREESFAMAMDLAYRSLLSEDFREGVAAYRAKRPPAFPPLSPNATSETAC
ncbi:enoyl-CoA hydratase-related protein [Dactylosporangium sp. NPDC051484]|uniref:enoyl-CoA hydratase-related protein n=1 Tax=Dactylosporangium sp. NPDC051484 TaxID=3154942 RepID=UPI00344E8120